MLRTLTLCVITFCGVVRGFAGEPATGKYLIIHADDAGMSHSVNRATMEAMEEGFVSSASIMVPCPWFSEFAEYARTHLDKDYGIHLTLNSEWRHYRWGPVAPREKVPTLVDQDGYLWDNVAQVLANAKADEVNLELRAQIDRALRFGVPLSHLDTHMGALFSRPDLIEVYAQLAHDYDLPILFLREPGPRLAREYPALSSKGRDVVRQLDVHRLPVLNNVFQFYDNDPHDQRRATYLEMLRNLPLGVSEVIIHCGYDNAELQAITSSASLRDSDRRIFVDPAIRREVEQLDIQVITWKQFHQMTAATSAPTPAPGGEGNPVLKAGAAVRVITPDPLLPVSGGVGPTAAVREKRGELTARALVLQQGDTSIAIVSLDLLGFPSVLGDRVRARVPTMDSKNILIGATHCHSAPDCYAFPDGQGGHTGDLEYIDQVCTLAADAINEAVGRLEPASLQIATGVAEGKIAYNYYAPDLYDRRMGVIRATSAGGQTIATLINYAIHPEVLGPDVGILSPDVIGPLCEEVESKSGGTTLFMNGAQGGMITADNRDLDRPSSPLRAYWHDNRTWEECERIGRLMAAEALRIVADAPRQERPRLLCTSTDIQFDVESDELWEIVKHSPLGYPHGEDRTVTTRVNLVNLGNAQILTIPGEALPNIGFYLKRNMRGEHNFLFGLTNDAFGYILTKVDFASFPRYDYVSRVSLGELTGERLIEQSLDLVERTARPARLP
jgi:predicted glycoside hydrolase/deacetylase ChbG (UPF0249 family)